MNETIRLIANIVTWQGEFLMCGHRMLLTRFKHCNRADKPEEGGMGKKCLFCDTSILMRKS